MVERANRGAACRAPLRVSPSRWAAAGARCVLALALALGLAAGPALAQTRLSLGVGAGSVRTEGGTSFSSASLSPALWYATPAFEASASGSFASLPAGVWASHGRLDLWGTTPRVTSRLRLGVEGILVGTSRTDGGHSSAAHALGELLWATPKWGMGLGAGPSAGWITNQPSVLALRTRARAWWRPSGRGGETEWQLSVEPTQFPADALGTWFTDVTAAVTFERGPAVLSLSSAARLSTFYGSTGAGSAFLQYFVAPAVSLELGAGSYLREPYEGFPRAGFFVVGLRIHDAPRLVHSVLTQRWAPLVPEARGDSLVVRFRFPSVRAVAIAGDWNNWQTRPLRFVEADVWEGTLALARGLYHFNLLVDGRDWVVPNGVATVPDGLGGLVGVLLVR